MNINNIITLQLTCRRGYLIKIIKWYKKTQARKLTQKNHQIIGQMLFYSILINCFYNNNCFHISISNLNKIINKKN